MTDPPAGPPRQHSKGLLPKGPGQGIHHVVLGSSNASNSSSRRPQGSPKSVSTTPHPPGSPRLPPLILLKGIPLLLEGRKIDLCRGEMTDLLTPVQEGDTGKEEDVGIFGDRSRAP